MASDYGNDYGILIDGVEQLWIYMNLWGNDGIFHLHSDENDGNDGNDMWWEWHGMTTMELKNCEFIWICGISAANMMISMAQNVGTSCCLFMILFMRPLVRRVTHIKNGDFP